MRTLVQLLLLLPAVQCQLRPRRVGTNAMGGQEQEVVLTDVPSGGDSFGAAGNADVGADAMAQMAQMMQQAMGGEGGGVDPMAMLKNLDMANNPMLKTLAASNPELAEMINNPEALQEQMKQVGEMLQSPEGQQMAGDMMKNMMGQMQDVMR